MSYNKFSYNTPYRFLRSDQRNLLSQREHRREREVFIDCLAVLHDVASAPAGTPGLAVFSASQIEVVLSRSWDWNAPPFAGLRNNLEINWGIAADLRVHAGEINARGYADEYVDSVIQQYQWLRRAEAAHVSNSITSGQSSS